MSNIVQRGVEHIATFNCATSVDTSTSINKQVCVSASATVSLFTFASANSIPIGFVRETKNTSCVVSLFCQTARGIAGGGVTAGGRIVAQSTTGYLIDAAGTLTANPIVGVAVTGANTSGMTIEFIPVQYGGVVIA